MGKAEDVTDEKAEYVTDEVVRLARVRELAASGEAKRRRLAAHLSLNEVGRPIGVSHTAVMNWERGRRRPTGPAALRYLELLDLLDALTQGMSES